ncbi:hypothetical protein [Streptomyces sp. NRRL S-495]|uniref:hypothetical protein n=1 Tax=Streptomyces sp. NRRL S-495 TaxID=1609133 RepID=UPI0005F8B42E|nr:hypothetical protein [Streptomyces sp. NRRL S-495]KJY27988.1 hypothetical protein VR45_33625 [Streptomyces sp. NRRL S-495]
MTLSAAMALAAPAPAGAEDTEPAVVVNGTFSSPTVPADKTFTAGADGWTTPGGVASASRAAHPQGFQAATLGWNSNGISISTRLRGIRAKATVTLSWDDNPDTCVTSSNAKRSYTVSVAGDINPAGAFTSNTPNGRANWFLGRTYSFTATEDAPLVTFTSTDTDKPACGALITNVAAKQTAPPLTPPQGGASSDPCSGDAKDNPQCKDLAADKEKIEKCPPTSKECLAGVAGEGKAEKDGIAKETQAVEDFGKIPRDQNPNTAATDLCTLPNALTAGVGPGDAVVPPSDWWFC